MAETRPYTRVSSIRGSGAAFCVGGPWRLGIECVLLIHCCRSGRVRYVAGLQEQKTYSGYLRDHTRDHESSG